MENMKASRPKQISEKSERLRKSIETLGVEVDQLLVAIEPVLSPDRGEPAETSAKGEDHTALAPHALFLEKTAILSLLRLLSKRSSSAFVTLVTTATRRPNLLKPIDV